MTRLIYALDLKADLNDAIQGPFQKTADVDRNIDDEELGPGSIVITTPYPVFSVSKILTC